MTATMETGYVLVPVAIEIAEPEPGHRADADAHAAKMGARIVGDPECLSVKDVQWGAGYEDLANSTTLKVWRWKMERPAKGQ